MTPRLRVAVTREVGSFRLDARLEVGSEILVLFGPSGSGKTMTLQCIAGLVTPDSGEIVLDGRTLFRHQGRRGRVWVPVRRRGVGYLFQQYALFPHMTALQNVAFPLPRSRSREREAMEILERMRLGHVATQYPSELSGGQQQRVALARAIAARPRVLLLDEPFSALDQGVRERLQRDLREIQAERGVVVIYVTHSLEEAFRMGDRLAVIRDGSVEQVGAPAQVLAAPNSESTARILGITNIFYGALTPTDSGSGVLDWGGLRLSVRDTRGLAAGRVAAYIRPEDVKIIYPGRPYLSPVRHNLVRGTITASHTGTTSRTLVVELPNHGALEVRFPLQSYKPLDLSPGRGVEVCLRPEAIVLLPG